LSPFLSHPFYLTEGEIEGEIEGEEASPDKEGVLASCAQPIFYLGADNLLYLGAVGFLSHPFYLLLASHQQRR
jgi:hypothetical protein